VLTKHFGKTSVSSSATFSCSSPGQHSLLLLVAAEKTSDTFKDNKLTLVATDGRRLASVDLEVEFPSSQETEIIVSTKAVTEIERLLREEGEVKLSIGDRSREGADRKP
jgi:hypothetical protein